MPGNPRLGPLIDKTPVFYSARIGGTYRGDLDFSLSLSLNWRFVA